MSVRSEETGPVRGPDWHDIETEGLEEGKLAAMRVAGCKLVVGRTRAGGVFALENRCPHEGYPLSQGLLKDGLLTCAWHNWKFDVQDGACVLGGEDVRRFPVRIEGGRVQVDLADPDPGILVGKSVASLGEGLHENDLGRSTRETVRLLGLGVDPWTVLREVALHDARHAEYGTTHVLPVAVDCGRLLGHFDGLDRARAIAPVLALCGETDGRLPLQEAAPPLPHDLDTLGEELRRAVEAEQADRAEGLLRHGLRSGVPSGRALEWILATIADHFLDFGHALIYWVKLRDLLERAPGAGDEELLVALLRGVVLGTREDTLPYWAPYSRASRARSAFAEVPPGSRAGVTPEPADVRRAALDGTAAEAVAAVEDALRAGVAPEEVAAQLVLAAAERLLRFDPAIDADPSVAENWLWATHRLTFASAVRTAVEGAPPAVAAPLLVQAVAFVHSGRGMDLPAERGSGELPPASASDDPGSVVAAVAAKDARAALAAARRRLAGDGAEALRGELERLLLRAPAVRPIHAAHQIKTTLAAFDERERLAGHPDRDLPVLAAIRYLASPVDEARVLQTVQASIAWVGEGRTPRKLTQ